MEAPKSALSNPESPEPYDTERDPIPVDTSQEAQPISVEEGGFVAEGIKLQAPFKQETATKYPETATLTEKALEERHEKKDDPKIQNTVSIGSVIAEIASRQPNLPQATPQTTPHSDATVDEVAVDDKSDELVSSSASLYHQATTAGFMVAMMIIVIFFALLIVVD